MPPQCAAADRDDVGMDIASRSAVRSSRRRSSASPASAGSQCRRRQLRPADDPGRGRLRRSASSCSASWSTSRTPDRPAHPATWGAPRQRPRVDKDVRFWNKRGSPSVEDGLPGEGGHVHVERARLAARMAGAEAAEPATVLHLIQSRPRRDDLLEQRISVDRSERSRLARNARQPLWPPRRSAR
jgi:hypothetical protein